MLVLQAGYIIGVWELMPFLAVCVIIGVGPIIGRWLLLGEDVIFVGGVSSYFINTFLYAHMCKEDQV